MKNCIQFSLISYWILTMISLSIAQPSQFRASGVSGGSALFYPSISPHNNNIIYAASDVNGMFFTKNAGESWDIIPSKELVATTESKVHFTTDPNILYTVCRDFITDRDYPCKSIDAGMTWKRLDHPILDGEVEYLFADPNHTDRLIVTTYEDMFCSEDGGATFERRYEAETDAGLHIGGVFWDETDIYVGSTDGLLVSNDGGGSFAKKSVEGLPTSFGFLSFSGAKQGNDIRFFSVARNKFSFYPGIQGSDYWEEESAFFCVEEKGNAEFETIAGFDFTQSNFPFYVASSEEDIQTVYVAGAQSEGSIYPSVWKSKDGGANWENAFDYENNGAIETGYMGDGGILDWQWSENAMGFAVSPTNPNIAVITDFSFLHITKDAGASWQATYVKPEERNPAGMLTPKSSTYSSNGLENTSVWNLHWSNPNQIFACFSDLTGLISTDGGTQWSLDYTGLDYFDEDDFTQKRYNSIYHISEHPQNKTMYAAASTLHDIYQTHVLTDNEVDGRGEIGAIWSSTNAGKDWTLLQQFEMPITQTAIDPNNTNSMYATAVHSVNGGIFKTANLSAGNNSNWEKLPNPPSTSGRANTIHVLNDGSVVSTFSGGQTNAEVFTPSSGVFYSQNEGQSWEDRSAPEMKYYTKGLTIDPHDDSQNTWYVGVFEGWPTGSASTNSGGLYRTINRGVTWEELGDFYRVESTAVHPNNPDIMYVATESEGLWYTDNLTTSNPIFRLLEEYPFLHPVTVVFNPFNVAEVWVTSFGNGIRKGEAMIVSTTNTIPFEYEVMVAPNPGHEFINIQLSDELVSQNRQLHLNLFDLTGRQVLETPLSDATYTINKSQTGSGIFIYHIREGGKRLAMGKLVFD